MLRPHDHREPRVHREPRLARCGGVSHAGTLGRAGNAVQRDINSPPTASPTPSGVISTTVAATKAPTGAIRIGMIGPPPRFRPDKLTVTAGVLVFFLTNTSLHYHTIAIGPAILGNVLAASDAVQVGRSAVFTVRGLPRGAYAIWCTVDDHAAEGMVGTLTVR